MKRYFIGDKIRYHYDDFDGFGNVTLTVTKVGKGFIVAEADGIKYRFEDFNEDSIISAI